MARKAVSAYFFAIIIVEHQGRFLLIRESKHGRRWYMPAGGVEPGETLVDAAIRETAEEAGVYVRPKGLLRIEHSWGVAGGLGYTRFRFVFLAHPVGSAEPKTFADEHSLEARWVSLDELKQYDLRGPDVVELFTLAASGAPLLPIEAYVTEGGG
jgi:phosphatase NudJ